MRELDVSKPLMFRDKNIFGDVEIEYLKEIQEYGEKRLLFIIKNTNGDHDTKIRYLVRNLDGTYLSGSNESEYDIINVPEKPAFSWDKPLRHIETGDICVAVYDGKDRPDDLMEKLCVFRRPDGTHWTMYFTLDGLSDLYQYDCELENYEPEKVIEVIELNAACNNLNVRWAVRAKNKHESKTSLGFFHNEEDAELFKQVKERGL